MRYTTIIKIACNGIDKEDASHTAGEYLRGNVDSGIDMKCKTTTQFKYQLMKYGFTGMTLLILCFILMLFVTPTEGAERMNHSIENTIEV